MMARKSKRQLDAERDRDEAAAAFARVELEASRLSAALAETMRKPGRGGKREGAGRPAGSEHDGWLRLRAPIEMLVRIDEAADAAGLTRAAWVRDALEDALRRA